MLYKVYSFAALFGTALLIDLALSDELVYRYEADVIPSDDAAAWQAFNPCKGVCSEGAADGHYQLSWPRAGDGVNYHYWIARTGEPLPLSLWVEWRFRSNHAIPRNSYDCDGRLAIGYRHIFDVAYMYGDAVTSRSGHRSVRNLELDAFHTYRFESPDGLSFAFYVDGGLIWNGQGNSDLSVTYIQFGGDGGCLDDQIPDMRNEWDFIRFGTLGDGEQIIAVDPQPGFVDARVHAGRDRFTITFDSPGYVYIDDIAVAVTDSDGMPLPENATPAVKKTWRRETNNDPALVEIDPCVVEIVLDRPIPMGATTRFTFHPSAVALTAKGNASPDHRLETGATQQVIEYTFAPGDTDGTGRVDLADAASLQNCFGLSNPTGVCLAMDLNRNEAVDAGDVPLFNAEVLGPIP